MNADGVTLDDNVGSGQAGVIKVPNALTSGTNVSFSSGTTYDGSAAIIISSTDTNTEYTAGTNLNLAGTTFNLDTSISGMINISFLDNGTATSITGGNYPSAPTTATYLDLTSTTNIILPPDVFEVSGDYRMTINLSNFMSNDDSSFYNIFAEDDGSGKIHGAIKPSNAVVEMVGYFIVPNGWTATAARVDATDSGGSSITRDLTFESFTTYGATGFSSLGTAPTGSESSFSSSMAGASDKLLLIRINTTSTTDHIRGGYIKLTR